MCVWVWVCAVPCSDLRRRYSLPANTAPRIRYVPGGVAFGSVMIFSGRPISAGLAEEPGGGDWLAGPGEDIYRRVNVGAEQPVSESSGRAAGEGNSIAWAGDATSAARDSGRSRPTWANL